ncbi:MULTISPECIES: LysE/ArgO family amino acid transporter [Nocardia]|uniref:Amino acid transporter n=1 Tax=Nocardia nova TaxID=37330 RepID=A0A2T2YZT9_9NOCA|nr:MULTISPECIES: LysE/ArgO family amino acid transporter [Nocardia]PSR60959.1 amino acid transporter [Nocardia nova]
MTSGIFSAALAGFGAGLSLIVAIGAQNAFVLRQGVRRQAVGAVVVICVVSDAILIMCGVGGLGALVSAYPAALTVAGLAGGCFLIACGALAARRALRPATGLTTTGDSTASLRTAILVCLAMTWLNPHVYLDTVLLLGSVAAGHGSLRWAFGVGAMVASGVWFAGLGYGARLLAPVLSLPAAWRVLDVFVAGTMFTLGVVLLTQLA